MGFRGKGLGFGEKAGSRVDGRLLRGVRELNLLFFQQTAEFLCLRISVQGFRLKGFRDFFGLVWVIRGFWRPSSESADLGGRVGWFQ